MPATYKLFFPTVVVCNNAYTSDESTVAYSGTYVKAPFAGISCAFDARVIYDLGSVGDIRR